MHIFNSKETERYFLELYNTIKEAVLRAKFAEAIRTEAMLKVTSDHASEYYLTKEDVARVFDNYNK